MYFSLASEEVRHNISATNIFTLIACFTRCFTFQNGRVLSKLSEFVEIAVLWKGETFLTLSLASGFLPLVESVL